MASGSRGAGRGLHCRMPWPALQAASVRDEHARVPFVVQERRVGSVARQHLPLLAQHARWVEQREGIVF